MSLVRFLPIVVAAGGVACAVAESTQAPAREPRPVRFDTAARYRARDGAVFPARVRADRSPALSFRIGGRITDVRVEVGDRVEAGTLLATLDPQDFQTRVADATAAVAQAEADAARTQRAADRAERLFKGNAVSEAERDQSRDLARAARARLESARQRLALAQRELAYTRLEAPESGVVVERFSDPGANVQAGQAIFALSGDGLEIRTDVPESALTSARIGAAAEIRVAAVGVGFRPGTVSRVSKGTSAGSVLYPVFVKLAEPDPDLVPGMAAEVRFLNGAVEDGVSVPPTAIVGDPDGAFVWVLEPTESDGEDEVMVARRRSVSVARLTARAAVIAEGLEVGEKVATAGASYLSEGRRVRPAKLPPLVFEGVHSPAPGPTIDISRGVEGR